MIVIGENINATSRSVARAVRERDTPFLQRLASAQASCGADYLDLNVGTGQDHAQEIADIEWLIEAVKEVTDKPLVMDSADPKVIEAGLRKFKGQVVMINSISAEEKKFKSLAPLVAGYDTEIIALSMDENGIPSEVEERIKVCDKILKRLYAYGVPPQKVFLDPLVLPIGVDTRNGIVTLKTLEKIKNHYPEARTILGLSNISHGLPLRGMINRAFLLMAIYIGLDCVIANPLDSQAMGYIKIGEMLVGKDPFCKGYLKAYREGFFKEE